MPIVVRMSIELANPTAFKYIVALAKKHATELGFIPAAAMENYLHRGRITLARENDDPCGFFLVGKLGVPQLRIFQACVQYDARGLKHGLLLLSDLITKAADSGTEFLSLHCRDGLESNGFWSACGFHLAEISAVGTSRRKVVHTWHLRIGDALADASLPYARHYLAALGRRAAEGTLSPTCSSITGTA